MLLHILIYNHIVVFNDACISVEGSECSDYVTYNVPNNLDTSIALERLAAFNKLKLSGLLEEDCIAAFNRFTCQDAHPKCLSDKISKELQYTCQSTCQAAYSLCEAALKQLNREDLLPDCQGLNAFGLLYLEMNCIQKEASTSMKKHSQVPKQTKSKEIDLSTLSPAAQRILIKSDNTENAINCDPESGLCIRCPMLTYFYEEGQATKDNRFYLSMMLTSLITSFIPVVLLGLNPQYRIYPARFVFWGATNCLLIFISISWAYFLTDEQWMNMACNEPDQVPSVKNNTTCASLSILVAFFACTANGWAFVVMSSLYMKVSHRSNWIDQNVKLVHLFIYLPAALLTMGIYVAEEASFAPGLFCYPFGPRAARVYYIYLLSQSIVSMIMLTLTMIQSIKVTRQSTVTFSTSSPTETVSKRAKMFIRPMLLVLWVACVTISQTVLLIISKKFFMANHAHDLNLNRSTPSSSWCPFSLHSTFHLHGFANGLNVSKSRIKTLARLLLFPICPIHSLHK